MIRASRLLFTALTANVVVVASVTGAESEPGGLPPPRFGAELGVGVEYDSNISVEEVDRASSESDYALTLDASLEMRQDLSDTTELALNYDYSQNSYNEFSQVDRQTHILGSDLSFKFGELDSGISAYYINSRLDGSKFLDLYRLSPSVSGFLAKKWFARGAYVYLEKSIESTSERDASTHAGEADLYYFRRGLRSYFNFGYRYKDENAEADRLDYQSSSAKIRYVHRIEVFSRLAKLELSWRYEERDYSSATPSIDEERADKRHRWRANMEMPLVGKSAVQVYYGYSDYDSNLPSADYSQTIVGTRFTYRW
ncbi:MAG: surface lipoprotein assembly modifier [Halioglobus sp.]